MSSVSIDQYTQEFPRRPASAGAARRFVERLLTATPAIDHDAAVLLTSELVTNAIVHGRGAAFQVAVRSEPDHLWVGVSDERPTMVPAPAGREVGGLGLPIVDRLSDGWGIDEPDRRHKCVWFNLGPGHRSWTP